MMPTPTDTKIGDRVASLRRKRGWTLAELARRTGVTRQGLAYVEQGVSAPTVKTLRALASALRVPLARLLG